MLHLKYKSIAVFHLDRCPLLPLYRSLFLELFQPDYLRRPTASAVLRTKDRRYYLQLSSNFPLWTRAALRFARQSPFLSRRYHDLPRIHGNFDSDPLSSAPLSDSPTVCNNRAEPICGNWHTTYSHRCVVLLIESTDGTHDTTRRL